MTPDQITQLRTLLRRANICKIIPGTVIIEAEVYNQILTLLLCPTCCGTGKSLEYATACPECGCEEYTNENQLGVGYRQCRKCHQDWWLNIKYGIGVEPCPDCQAPELPDATYCQSCGKITDDLDEGFRCPDCQQHTS